MFLFRRNHRLEMFLLPVVILGWCSSACEFTVKAAKWEISGMGERGRRAKPMNLTHSRIPLNWPWASMNDRRAPRQSQLKLNTKSKEKIQLSKWHEQTCFWRPNSNYHRKWRGQACLNSCMALISNSNRMRNICRNGARFEADIAQQGPTLLLLVQFFSTPPCLSHVFDFL